MMIYQNSIFIYLHILYIFALGVYMATMTLAVPSDLKKRMDDFSEMNWSEVARQAFRQKIEDLEFLQKFKSESKLTEQDAQRLGKQVNKAIAKRLA